MKRIIQQYEQYCRTYHRSPVLTNNSKTCSIRKVTTRVMYAVNMTFDS
jgi:hypothetical protein